MIQNEVWSQLAAAYAPGTPKTSQQFQIRDSIYVHDHHAQTLKPHWKGPYLVLLTITTAVKVQGIATWIHASHVKSAHQEDTRHLPIGSPDVRKPVQPQDQQEAQASESR